MLKKILLIAPILAGSLALSTTLHGAEINVYSARKEELIKPILDTFTARSGITINLLTGDADVLLKRLETEGKQSPADMLITTDAGRLSKATELGLLQETKSEGLKKAVPANLAHPDGYWFGISIRARPIVYSPDRVKTTDLSTYEDLANTKWKGRICMRPAASVYNQSFIASLISTLGPEKTAEWLKGFVKNFSQKPVGGDRDQVKEIASGRCDLTLVNTYYLAGMLTSKDPAEKAAASKVAVFWPNQENRGSHINISGAGITKSAKNTASARKLLEFLVSDEAQMWYANVNNEYPIRNTIPTSDLLKEFGNFRSDKLNLGKFASEQKMAVMLMDQSGWL